jgi:hypothetical protein
VYVVIVGAKLRDAPEDKAVVCALMELAAKRYPNCCFVTMLTSMGVGSFVKQKCLEKDSLDRFRFQLIECNVRLYASNLSQSESSTIYIARNATVYEMGDVFLYLAMPDRRGPLEDLIDRAVRGERPYRVFLPGDELTLP